MTRKFEGLPREIIALRVSRDNPGRCLGPMGNIGGSMDLTAGAAKLFIAMEHTTPGGEPKILRELTYPAAARGKANEIFTDLAVIELQPEGLILQEIYPRLTPQDLQSVTEARLIISSALKEIELLVILIIVKTDAG